MDTIIFDPVTLALVFDNFNLANNFWTVVEFWYFTWVFLVIRPFCGCNYFLPCDLDLIFEKFNLANNFWTVRAKALIFHLNIPWDKVPFYLMALTLLRTFELWVLEFIHFTWIFVVAKSLVGTNIFYPVTLTLKFDLFLKNINLANNFWTVSARAFIFHMYILWDKTFQWVPTILTLRPWPWSLTY